MQPMMKCGHAANSTTVIDGERVPACVICAMIPGLGDAGLVVDDHPPDLSERRARCAYYGTIPKTRNHESNHGCKRGEPCLCEEPSDGGEKWAKYGLAFFEHKPKQEYDEFYCGCHGWD